MESWLATILLAIALAIAVRRLLNELDHLLGATERFAEHLGDILGRLWRAIGSPGRHLAKRAAILVVAALLIAFMWLPWLR